MTFAVDLSNLAVEANGTAAGITANATAITAIFVGNSTVNTTINSTAFSISGSPVGGVNTSAQYLFSNTISFGNSTVNSSINATSLTVGSNVASIGTSVFFLANGIVSIGMPLGDVPSGYGKLVVKGGAAGTSNSNITVSTPGLASDERADIALYSTFGSYPSDIGPRRTADIIAGFTTTWGGEYLSFNVGQGGGSNDGRLLSLEKMRIVSNGNVGIGNSTPGSALVVNGAIITGNTDLGNNQVATVAFAIAAAFAL